MTCPLSCNGGRGSSLKELIEGCRRVLRSLISETVVFVAGVEMAEAHPDPDRPLSEVISAINHFASLGGALNEDPYTLMVAEGVSSSPEAMDF